MIAQAMIQIGVWGSPYAMLEDGLRDGVRYPVTMINPLNVVSVPRHFLGDRVFIVPGGMGDIAWVYAKLCNLKEPFVMAVAGDAQTRGQWTLSLRSMPFIELLENVKYATVAACGSDQVCWSAHITDYTNGHLPSSPAFIACNRWLESGSKLDKFLPLLNTTRHFPMKRPQWAMDESYLFLGKDERAFAVYPSSATYFANQNLPIEGWLYLIQKLAAQDLDRRIILMGAPWDLTLLVPLYDALCSIGLGDRVTMMHDRHLAVTLEVLRRCDFLVGAVCGLTIVAEYQGVPTVHLYPKTHLADQVLVEDGVGGKQWKGSNLFGTWESPDMIRDRRSLSLRIPDGQHVILDKILDGFAPVMA